MDRTRTVPAVIGTLILVACVGSAMATDEEDRARVKDFSFDFTPSQEPADGVPPLDYCLVPLLNSNKVERHTRNVEKAFRNMTPAEYPRVVGFRFNANGKPLNRFLAADTFEGIVARALHEELAALGMTEVPSPVADPPENLRESTLVELANSFAAGNAPDILIAGEIQDFYFETVPGPFKIKMETSFIMEVFVLDVRSGKLIWDGEIETGVFEKKAMAMGRNAVENRLNEHFATFIGAVVRNNEELKTALAKLEE